MFANFAFHILTKFWIFFLVCKCRLLIIREGTEENNSFITHRFGYMKSILWRIVISMSIKRQCVHRSSPFYHKSCYGSSNSSTFLPNYCEIAWLQKYVKGVTDAFKIRKDKKFEIHLQIFFCTFCADGDNKQNFHPFWHSCCCFIVEYSSVYFFA
jgi:hypothetical protein